MPQKNMTVPKRKDTNSKDNILGNKIKIEILLKNPIVTRSKNAIIYCIMYDYLSICEHTYALHRTLS